jgi:hypothetical protein
MGATFSFALAAIAAPEACAPHCLWLVCFTPKPEEGELDALDGRP